MKINREATRGFTLEELLSRLESVKEEAGGQYRADCPTHESKSGKALHVGVGDNGKPVLKCFGGCEYEDIIAAVGLNGSSPGADPGPRKNSKKKHKVYTTKDVYRQKVFEFRSPSGEVLYVQQHKGPYFRPISDNQWVSKLDDVTRVPYNLPELLEGVRSERTIFHVEGCKDVGTATEWLEVTATTTGGVDTWRPEFRSFYTGADVVIVPDNDDGGRKYALTVADDVRGVARSVKIIDLPDVPPKGDLTDFREMGRTKEDFFGIVRDTPYYRPETDSGNSGNSGNRVEDENAEPWTAPAAFHSFDLPEFPEGIFSGWISDYTEALSVSTQTPRDLAGMLGLTVGAVVCAKLVEVEVWDGWREPTNIFTATALRPGTRKTEVFKRIFRPVVEYEKELVDETAKVIAKAYTKYRVYEGRLKRAEQQAAKAEPNELEDLETKASEAAEDLANIEVPSEPQLLADDASPESLASILARQGGRVALISDEGGVFDMMAGRYSQGIPNLDVYLKGHAGVDLRVDRVGRPADRVLSPALTTGLAVQPDVLRGLASKPGFRGRGLLGRYLYSKPKDTLGVREVRKPGVPGAIEDRYRAKIKQLLELSPDLPQAERKPHTLRLEDAAQDEMEAFQRWIEPRLADGAEFGDMTDWAGKLAGAVARIAGVLHMLDHAGEKSPWNHKINADAVRRAIKVGHYLTPHAKYALAFMGSDPTVEDAKYILKWVEKSGSHDFTKRDAWQGTKGRFDKVSQLEPGLELLIAHGYIREDPNQPQPRGPGRKPSPRYEVNPLFQPERHSHNSHNSHNPPEEAESEWIEGAL